MCTPARSGRSSGCPGSADIMRHGESSAGRASASSTSSVCCPGAGAGCGSPGATPSKRIAGATCSTGPNAGSSTRTTIALCRGCGSSNTDVGGRCSTAQTSASMSRATQNARGRDAKIPWISRSSSSACSGVSGTPMSIPDSLGGMRSSRPRTCMRRPKAPTAPVWMPRYSSSLHTNERVTRRIRLAPVIARMSTAPAAAIPASDSPHSIDRYAERAVEQRRLDVATDAVVETSRECRERAEHREVRGARGRERQTLEDRAVAVAGLLRHRADERVHQRLVRREVAMGAIGTERGDRGVDEARIPSVHRVVAEIERRRDAGCPALDQHIRAICELQDTRPSAGVLEVEDHAALGAVEHRCRGREPATRRVAAGWLDPRHVGPVVGEQPRGLRPGGSQRAVDDAESCEGSRHGSTFVGFVRRRARTSGTRHSRRPPAPSR